MKTILKNLRPWHSLDQFLNDMLLAVAIVAVVVGMFLFKGCQNCQAENASPVSRESRQTGAVKSRPSPTVPVQSLDRETPHIKTGTWKTGGAGTQSPSAPSSKRALARVTFYSADTCPWGRQSATGVRLVQGRHCAVDPDLIPFGSRVQIPGIGELRAVDTGTDVKSRKAARLAGHSKAQRQAIVVDVFCQNKSQMERLVDSTPAFLEVTWNE